jgi:hypothetical protein
MTNPISAQPLDRGICPYCGSILFNDPAHIRPREKSCRLDFLASPADQEQQIWLGHTFLIVTPSGRQVCLPATSLIYLGRRDEENNLYPHIDFTQDDSAMYGVSRRHAFIHQSDDGICIEDVGSANGTFVNGQRMRPFKPFPLHHGDVVQLGQFELRIAFWHEKTVIRPH